MFNSLSYKGYLLKDKEGKRAYKELWRKGVSYENDYDHCPV